MTTPTQDQTDRTASIARFSMAFTFMVMGWNNAEVAARDMLSSLSKGGMGAAIAIHQLGNVSLPDALLTVCSFLRSIQNELGNEQADHVAHFVKGMDILRPHRNFYVHNLRVITTDDKNAASGSLFGLDVKGGYHFINHCLSYDELNDLTIRCLQLKEYGEKIASSLAATFVQGPPAAPLSSLEKPIWPERLKRTRNNLITPLHPPQS